MSVSCGGKSVESNAGAFEEVAAYPKVVMVMGFNRSGTNALFLSLGEDPRVRAFNEHRDNEIYHGFCLRPEPEIRARLSNVGGPVLLKPVKEVPVRHLADIFEEYETYDPEVVWIYRNPVNVFYSIVRKWPRAAARIGWQRKALNFAANWNAKNREALSYLRKGGERLCLVKYEDLAADTGVFRNLSSRFGFRGKSLFRHDRMGGMKYLSEDLRAFITQETDSVYKELDDGRTWLPVSSGICRHILRLKGCLLSLSSHPNREFHN